MVSMVKNTNDLGYTTVLKSLTWCIRLREAGCGKASFRRTEGSLVAWLSSWYYVVSFVYSEDAGGTARKMLCMSFSRWKLNKPCKSTPAKTRAFTLLGYGGVPIQPFLERSPVLGTNYL